MRILKWIVVLALFAFVLMAGVLFTLQNKVFVPLDLLAVQLPEQPLALWIFLAFTVGGLIGVGVSTLTIIRLKGESALLRRRLVRREKDQGRARQRESNLPATKS